MCIVRCITWRPLMMVQAVYELSMFSFHLHLSGTTECSFCGAGKYQTGIGFTGEGGCSLCGAGKYQTGFGMISENNCSTEAASCTQLSISPASGLCSGQTFSVSMCTGSSPVFSFSRASLNSWVWNQTQRLSNYTQTSCPANQACKNFLPWSSVPFEQPHAHLIS